MMPAPAHPLRHHRTYVVLAAMVFFLAACSGSSSSADDGSSPTTSTTTEDSVVGPKEFARYLAANPDVPLINVHIPYEGHIEGTDSFVPFDEIGDWNGLPDDKDSPLAIYCRSGRMSATATKTLAAMGYHKVIDLEGGMISWSAAGFDLLDEQPPPS